MHNIRLHGTGLTEPTLRYGVLTVVHIALFAVITLVVYFVLVSGAVRIPVTYIAVGSCIGFHIGIIQSTIADHVRVLDNIEESCFQRFTLLSIGSLIVGA